MSSACRPDLACPRCGYDLSALPPTWSDVCPLTGTCSECGQSFEWRERFDPSAQDIVGFVEHSIGRSATLTAAWITLWWLIGWTFWNRISIVHRVVPFRMAFWFMLTIGTLHLVAGALAAARMVWLLRGMWGPGAPPGGLSTEGFLAQSLSPFTYPVAATSWGRGFGSLDVLVDEWPAPVLGAIVAHVAAFLLMFVVPATRRLARVHTAHVLRAGVYGFAFLVPLIIFRLLRNMLVLAEIAISGARSRLVTFPGFPGPPSLQLGGPTPIFIEVVPEPLLAGVLALWVAAWWYLAFRRGWGIPRAGVVWLVLAIPCSLAAFAVLAWRSVWMW